MMSAMAGRCREEDPKAVKIGRVRAPRGLWELKVDNYERRECGASAYGVVVFKDPFVHGEVKSGTSWIIDK